MSYVYLFAFAVAFSSILMSSCDVLSCPLFGKNTYLYELWVSKQIMVVLPVKKNLTKQAAMVAAFLCPM